MQQLFRHPKTGRPRWPMIALGVLLGAICVYMLVTGWRVAHYANRLRLRAARITQLSQTDVAQLGPLLRETTQDLVSLRRSLNLPLWLVGQVGWVPWIGPTLEAAPVLFDAGLDLMHAAGKSYGIVEPWVIVTLDNDASALALSDLMDILTAHRADLEAYAQAARSAVARVQTIDAARLLPRVATLLARVQPLLDLAPLGIEALAMAPDLVGAEPRTFLLLAQNNHELRATGGFISAIATLTLGYDSFELSPFVDSYQVENWNAPHPDPPEPLREHMGIDLWVTRDGNWWPDFPTSAQAVADLYTLNQGTEIDGVIAADLYAAQSLLETLTPLSLGSGRQVQAGEVDILFRESWGLPTGSLLTKGVVITATQPFTAIEVGLHYPAVQGQVWFDAAQVMPSDQGDGNLLTNPSFEQDQDQDGLPDDWLVEGLGSSAELTSSRAFEGQHSVSMIGNPEHAQRLWQRLDVQGQAGSTWRVSAQSAAQGVPVGQAAYAMTLAFIAEDGSSEKHQLTFPAFTHDWATAGSAEILGDWWRHRKDIIGEAMSAALAKIAMQPTSVDWDDVARCTQAMLDQRHIQIAFFESAPAAWMADYGWDGALRQSQPDFLMVVDSNVGFNKVTASMEQSLDYQVDLSAPDRPLAMLTLLYTNTSTVGVETCDKFTQYVPTYDLLTQGCYWDYVRIYVPKGVELLKARGGQEPVEQFVASGHRVFASSLLVPPGETEQIVLVYRLPAMTECYGLTLQKQAGVVEMMVHVSVLNPPVDVTVNSGSFERLGDGKLIWRHLLTQDRELLLCTPE